MSRWKKPYLFVTILIIWITVSLAIAILSTVDFLYNYEQSLKESYSPRAIFSLIVTVPAIFVLVIAIITSVIGNIELYKIRKSGLYISLIAIFFLSINLFFGIAGMLAVRLIIIPSPFDYLLYAPLIITLSMYYLLVLSWRKVEWQ